MPSNNRREHLIKKVRDIAQDLSGVVLENVAQDATFLDLGFDSLFLTQLSAACQKTFSLRITFRQLFSELPTIAALGSYLDEKLPAEQTFGMSEKKAEIKIPAPVESADAPRVPVIKAPPPPQLPTPPIAAPVQQRRIECAIPAVSSGPVSSGEMEVVLFRQIELMAAQLRFLQGLPADSILTEPTTTHELQPAVPLEVTSTPSVATSDGIAVTAPAKSPDSQKRQEVSAAKPAPGFGPAVAKSSSADSLTPRQQKHLEKLITNYARKTAGSKERTQRYRSRLADPRTAAGFNRRWKDIVYPIWVERSLGSKLWDVDGNQYIDLLNGFGPNFLGYGRPFITQAIAEQLEKGFEIGPQTMLVGEVAEMICKLTGMDRASFTCSGSEAVQAAMRLSRTYTGRDKVVVFSRDYHGNFDQVLVHGGNRDGKLRTLPSAPGIPFQSVDDTYVLEYGADESLDIIKKYSGDIAAVIVEPVQSRRPEFQPREFLHEVRRITRDAGIVLVFDEVVNGFRCAQGGAQAYFGVEADLATYGKVIGGGMPIGVVAGRSWVMDIFDGGFWQYGDNSFPEAGVTFFAGTFVRHPLSIAAAHASLKYIIQEGPGLQQRVTDKAATFADQVNAIFKKHELNIELPRFTSQMYLRNSEQAELANLLGYHLRYRGVHIVEGFPCYMTDAHSDEDIDHLVKAFSDSVETMVEDGIFGKSSHGAKGTREEEGSNSLTSVVPENQPSISPASALSAEHAPTELQKEMWVAAQMSLEASAASNGTNVVELDGELDVNALKTAIAKVVDRHEALRSTFSEDGTRVVVHESMPIQLEAYDLTAYSCADAATHLTEILEQDGRQVFNLAKGPLASFRLMKMSPKQHLLVFTAHMIICDGWGFKVVLEEIGTIYSSILEKHHISLEPPQQMREYAAWHAQEQGQMWTKECEKFWLSQYRLLPPVFDLPSSNPRPPVRSYDAGRTNLQTSPELYREIKRVARELRSTPFALLLTAFSTWLYKISNIDDFVIGVPFAGQSALGFNSFVGQCVHTLPFRIKTGGDVTFAEQLNRTQKQILDGQEYWSTSFGELVQKMNVPMDPGRMPLAPVIFNLDPVLTGIHFAGCDSRTTSGPRFFFHYDLGFNVIDKADSLLVECDYNSNLFDRETIQYWLNGFQTLLGIIVANAGQKLGQMTMLSESERPQPRERLQAPPRQNSRAREFVAPRNETEKRLAEIWSAVLKLDRVSCNANFFELGGQSIAAVAIFAKMEQEFGRKLPLATLFTSPTIESLAKALQGNKGSSSWSPLVPISKTGSNPPLFLVHGAGGNVLLYRSLAERLAPDYPLYGLQSKGLDGLSEPLKTIEEMAACYTREVRAVQPRGPYFLGGYCLGGTVAYEMAQLLRREGEEVLMVAMLDTYNYSRALKVNFRSFLTQKLKFHLANMAHLRPRDMIPYFREKLRLGLGGELANLRTSMPGGSREDGVARATSGAEAKVQGVNDYAAERYEPLPYAGRLTLFKPRINYKFYPDPNMGWGDLALGGLDIVEVSVNPHSMLLEPYVSVLAAELKQRIGVTPSVVRRK